MLVGSLVESGLRPFRHASQALIWAAVLSLAGCGRQTAEHQAAENPSGQETAPVPSTAPSAATRAAAVPAPPADSSLAIKRGVITGGEHPLFHACDDPTELWLVDESDGSLTQLFTDGVKSVYAEVYGERTPVPPGLAEASAYQGAFVLEQLLYAGNSAEIKGCEVPAVDYAVAARGSEPSWAVQVTDTQMIWKQPEAPKEITLDGLQSQDAEGTVSYAAAGNGHTVELLIDAQPCRDSMSGEFFGFAARAKLDGKEFKGCARVGK